MIKLNQLRADVGARKKKHRVGRGHASGSGQQAGKGHKGQNSRSGGGVPYQGFEGGQKPLYKRSPKLRGFNAINSLRFAIVNLSDIAELNVPVVDIAVLAEAGLVRKSAKFLKILGTGEVTTAITVKAHKFSESAVKKLEAAKGTAEVLFIKEKVKTNIRAIAKAKVKANAKVKGK